MATLMWTLVLLTVGGGVIDTDHTYSRLRQCDHTRRYVNPQIVHAHGGAWIDGQRVIQAGCALR